MNLRNMLIQEHSKVQCEKIVQWVGNDQERFDQLFTLFLQDEYRVVQRAAWPLGYAVQAHPVLIKKHFAQLICKLRRPDQPVAVKRNTVRILQDLDIPKKFNGEVMHLCFQFISAPEETAAVKAFSLTILYQLSKIYPEIRRELRLVIEERWPHETASFHARARKILQQL
ncbi:MAG: hypothetical protein GC171_07715 [Terrimonas sp.]|nr:hypothetical protein [Terrimonas sp.]